MKLKTAAFIPLLIIYCNTPGRSEPPPRYVPEVDFDRLCRAIVMVETGGRHYRDGRVVISDKGAIGLYQVMPDTVGFFNQRTGNDYRVADIYDRKINALVGRWYIGFLLNRFGDMDEAISAYLMGHNSGRHARIYTGKVKYHYYIGLKNAD